MDCADRSVATFIPESRHSSLWDTARKMDARPQHNHPCQMPRAIARPVSTAGASVRRYGGCFLAYLAQHELQTEQRQDQRASKLKRSHRNFERFQQKLANGYEEEQHQKRDPDSVGGCQ